MPILLPDMQEILKALENHRKEILNTKNPEEVFADPIMMHFFNEYDENVMNCTYLIDSFDQLRRKKIVFSNFRKEYMKSKSQQTQPSNVHVFRESLDGSQGHQQGMMEQMNDHQQNYFMGNQNPGGVQMDKNFDANAQSYRGPTQNYGGPSDQFGGGFQQNFDGGHGNNHMGGHQHFGAQGFAAGGQSYVGAPQKLFDEGAGEQFYVQEQQLHQEQLKMNSRHGSQSGANEGK
jgi:hypothetical protein